MFFRLKENEEPKAIKRLKKENSKKRKKENRYKSERKYINKFREDIQKIQEKRKMSNKNL